jgi:hypothetical protein
MLDTHVPRDVIDRIVAELERLAAEACDHWALPKREDPVPTASWRNREMGYRDSLRLLADAGLAPVKYRTRAG